MYSIIKSFSNEIYKLNILLQAQIHTQVYVCFAIVFDFYLPAEFFFNSENTTLLDMGSGLVQSCVYLQIANILFSDMTFLYFSQFLLLQCDISLHLISLFRRVGIFSGVYMPSGCVGLWIGVSVCWLHLTATCEQFKSTVSDICVSVKEADHWFHLVGLSITKYIIQH